MPGTFPNHHVFQHVVPHEFLVEGLETDLEVVLQCFLQAGHLPLELDFECVLEEKGVAVAGAGSDAAVLVTGLYVLQFWEQFLENGFGQGHVLHFPG